VDYTEDADERQSLTRRPVVRHGVGRHDAPTRAHEATSSTPSALIFARAMA
jgi:hypothetical protein